MAAQPRLDIGLIGAGYIGGVLAKRLVALGHQVKVANSRGPETLADLAASSGATAATVQEAASARDIVVVTIPQKAVTDLPKGLLSNSKAVVVDTGNYYPKFRDGPIEAIENGLLDSQWVAQVLGRPVIKAFNNIYYVSLDKAGKPRGSEGRIALPVAGDDAAAKKVVIDLIDELGFDGFDAGTLADSWRQQPGTPVYSSDLSLEAAKAAIAAPEFDGIKSRRAAADEQAAYWVSQQQQQQQQQQQKQ